MPTFSNKGISDQHKKPTKLLALHYLRGLAALTILLYHSWTFMFPKNDDSAIFINRLGIYGVSIFFILSGLTLFHVYAERLVFRPGGIARFYLKRIFRIFPLFWLVTTITWVLPGKELPWSQLFLNYSGLFGLLQPDAGIATGAWSIGNELVFYLLFPLLLFAFVKSRAAAIGIFLVTLAAAILFSEFLFNPLVSLREQSSMYIHPANQLFLFCSGILIGLLTKKLKLPQYIYLLLAGAAVLVMYGYPASGDRINIVTGPERWIFSGLCMIICFAMYKVELRLPQFLHRLLYGLGETSYSIYLLHPPVISLVVLTESLFLPHISKLWVIAIAIPLSLAISYLSFHFLEYPANLLGQKLVATNAKEPGINLDNKPEK